MEEGSPAAAVEEGEPGDRAFLLAAVEEGEARGPTVPIVEGETGPWVEEGGPAVPKPAGSVSKESL